MLNKKDVFAELHHIYTESNFNPVERSGADFYLEKVMARFEKAQLKSKYSSVIVDSEKELQHMFAP